VAEYNPFHNGHAWMVDTLRARGAVGIVCVMSGPFVQRAEAAFLPFDVRAKAALACGVDLILRLPVGWAVASAEGFARGAAGLLSALGCVDVLAFGAECPETGRLEQAAQVLLSGEFPPLLKRELARGISFAAARAAAAEELMPGAAAVLAAPNNILGVEYIKALRSEIPKALRGETGTDTHRRAEEKPLGRTAEANGPFKLPSPLALPRVGARHGGEPAGPYASAGWLRGRYSAGGLPGWEAWVPPAAMALYAAAAAEGAVLDAGRYEVALMSRLRAMRTTDLARFPGAGEGLETRLAGAVLRCTTPEAACAAAKTKRFAHSRVRRLALAAALGLPRTLPAIPPFVQVLAAGGRGVALLRRIKQNTLVPVSTSLARLEGNGGEASRVAALEALCEDWYALCLKTPRPGGGAYTRPAAMPRENGPANSGFAPGGER
jgi:predicted nucleotidyltransferase